MEFPRISSLLAGAAALGLATTASAHNIDQEPQSSLDWQFLANAVHDSHPYNYSFENPHDLTAEVPVSTEIEDGEVVLEIDPENGVPTWLGGVLTSRASFAYLDGASTSPHIQRWYKHWERWGWVAPTPDVDVYNFTVLPGADLAQAQMTPAAAAFAAQGLVPAVINPIPPACEGNKNDYPAIALTIPCSFMIDGNGNAMMTPFGPAQTQFIGPVQGDLPFDSTPSMYFTATGIPTTIYSAPAMDNGPYAPPTEMCVAQVAYNYPSEDRVVFEEPHTGASWFMPTGCVVTPANVPICNGDYNQDGIPEAPPAPGIFYPLPAMLPFPYTNQVIVWNPAGTRMDYTLNSGFAEGFPWVAHNHALEETLTDNDWTIHHCAAPE